MADEHLKRDANRESSRDAIKSLIRTIPDYPKPGIMFRDITTLLKDPVGFRLSIDELADRYEHRSFDKVIGIESRGLIFGSALAYRLGKGFVPIRKQGKLPAETIEEAYDLEYGTARMEIHLDAVGNGEKVVIVDDLIATGGTAEAAARLVELLGGEVVECCFVVDLPDLGGRNRLRGKGIASHALCEFEGE
jgi:adenine phosphoribosyltransferase